MRACGRATGVRACARARERLWKTVKNKKIRLVKKHLTTETKSDRLNKKQVVKKRWYLHKKKNSALYKETIYRRRKAAVCCKA